MGSWWRVIATNIVRLALPNYVTHAWYISLYYISITIFVIIRQKIDSNEAKQKQSKNFKIKKNNFQSRLAKQTVFNVGPRLVDDGGTKHLQKSFI